VASPWSRGGWTNSQVFDHTSVLRFLEVVTGVQEPNISTWRRQICGDLTSCFDFTKPDYTIPTLPDTTALMAKADANTNLPAVKLPTTGTQALPPQEQGERPHRRLPYRPWADLTVDRSTGTVTCTMTNSGTVAFPYTVYPNIVYAFAGTPFTVAPGATKTYTWDAATTDGRYDFTVHGPDGFVRRFAGTVTRTGQDDTPVPSVTATPGSSSLTLQLVNDGGTEVFLTAAPNDFAGTAQTVWLAPNSRTTLGWPLDQGRYDVVVTGGNGTRFTQRYAGTLH
ncbi:phospholipase domain-containing protein, partial [Kitasatospora sp. NPDC094015]|uniref:phospholipase domain-containing protein n=1 Tax=Kitasatospora sp. NPDC094015 TaxID=3155205 RepID=UPI003329ECF2